MYATFPRVNVPFRLFLLRYNRTSLLFILQPSWRHVPNAKAETMIVYRGSDMKYSWDDQDPVYRGQRMCDYVKEGNETTGRSNKCFES